MILRDTVQVFCPVAEISPPKTTVGASQMFVYLSCGFLLFLLLPLWLKERSLLQSTEAKLKLEGIPSQNKLCHSPDSLLLCTIPLHNRTPCIFTIAFLLTAPLCSTAMKITVFSELRNSYNLVCKFLLKELHSITPR